MELYHASPAKFDKFRPAQDQGAAGVDIGVHLGTRDTALARARDLEILGKPARYLYRVEVPILNSIRLSENRTGSWGPFDILRGIFEHSDAVIPQEKLDLYWSDEIQQGGSNWLDDLATESAAVTEKRMAKFLKELGYDSVQYRNEFEGGGDSYIWFEPSLIRILDTEEIKTPTAAGFENYPVVSSVLLLD